MEFTVTACTDRSYGDADILVSEGWLGAVFGAFERNDADAVGGRFHLDLSVRRPEWIPPDEEMLGFVGHQDFGDQPFLLDGESRYPFGANRAFNRRVVDRIGFFSPQRGRKGEGRKRSKLFQGAATDYFQRVAAAGQARIVYEPEAIVYHRLIPFPLRKSYSLQRRIPAGPP
jgi:hypothetical protein